MEKADSITMLMCRQSAPREGRHSRSVSSSSSASVLAVEHAVDFGLGGAAVRLPGSMCSMDDESEVSTAPSTPPHSFREPKKLDDLLAELAAQVPAPAPTLDEYRR